MYKIRNLELKSRVFLAPMLEPNDIAFRLLCKRAGCELTWTGMTSALSKARIDLDDRPILQLFGNNVRGIASFMKKYDSEVSGWDFNLGCPSKLSRRLGHGACLDDLEVIGKILGVMRANTDKFLSVKIRKSERAFDILKIAEEVGLDAIIVHARTLSQGYSGEVDYGWALELKKRSGIPVIFSGVSDISRVSEILKDFDFVMIGREAIGRPGVFGRNQGSGVRNQRILFGEYLKLARKYDLKFRQVKYQAMNFSKGVLGGRRIRERLVGANGLEDIREIMTGL